MCGNFRQPLTHASLSAVAIGEDIFETEACHGIGRQGLERHVLQEIGRKPVQHSVGRVGAIDRPEIRTVVIQRLRHPTDQCFVLLDQLKVPLSHRRVDNVPIAIRRDEEMLDHAVRAQQVDAIQEQLWVRGNALVDGGCQFEPLLAVATVRGVLVSLEQRHETLNQRREIEGIGVAGAQNQAALIERHTLLRGAVAKLGAQMPARHSNASFLDFNPVLRGKGLGDSFRDFEIGPQLIGRGALCQREQPSRISHEHGLIGRCGSPQFVEHALNLRQPIAGAPRAGVPQAHRNSNKPPHQIQVERACA